MNKIILYIAALFWFVVPSFANERPTDSVPRTFNVGFNSQFATVQNVIDATNNLAKQIGSGGVSQSPFFGGILILSKNGTIQGPLAVADVFTYLQAATVHNNVTTGASSGGSYWWFRSLWTPANKITIMLQSFQEEQAQIQANYLRLNGHANVTHWLFVPFDKLPYNTNLVGLKTTQQLLDEGYGIPPPVLSELTTNSDGFPSWSMTFDKSYSGGLLYGFNTNAVTASGTVSARYVTYSNE